MRWILVGTAAIWVVLELRQSLTYRPDGVKAGWGSEILFRLIVGVGVGVGLFIGNWWSLVCLTAATAGGLVFRIRLEERALMHNLGDRYRDYAATHKRLVPFIW